MDVIYDPANRPLITQSRARYERTAPCNSLPSPIGRSLNAWMAFRRFCTSSTSASSSPQVTSVLCNTSAAYPMQAVGLMRHLLLVIEGIGLLQVLNVRLIC